MFDDPPPLVDANANAGATPWYTARSRPVTPGVIPGGFGAGTPHLQPQQQQQPYGPNATPGRKNRPLGRRGGGMGHSPAASDPWMLAPPSHHHPDPFSVPAAAYDQGYAFPPGGYGSPHQGGVQLFHPPAAAAAAPPPPPPPFGMPSPQMQGWFAPPRTHDQDPEDGEEDWAIHEGWGADSPPEVWNPYELGKMSPSPSMINGFASGPRSQYKRPEEWRPDFSMSKSGGLTRVFSFGKSGKGSGFSLFNRPSVHRTLDAKASGCSWDIRRPPDAFLVLPDQRPLTYLELQEGAMTPPPLQMRLKHAMLPWTVHVSAGTGSVITIAHLLSTLHAELNRQVFQRDFWNDDVSEEDRKRIYDAWVARCAGDKQVADQGIKRVDFLGDRWVFEGIRRVGDAWEMKLKSGRKRI